MSRRQTRRRPQPIPTPLSLNGDSHPSTNGNGKNGHHSNGNGHHANGTGAYAVLPPEPEPEVTPRGVDLLPTEPLGLVAPGETRDLFSQEFQASYCWKGRLARKPWEHPITAVIPHCETPELLPVVIELLRWQTVRPYIMVIDTGSRLSMLDELEKLRAEDVEIHYVRGHGYPHSSEVVACAMDLAFSVCRSEYLFATHSDCFLMRRDYLEYLLRQCGPEVRGQSPAVGYEMSDRSQWCGDEWRGMISHTASLFHMPTMHAIGASWGFHRGHTQFGQNRDTNCWPDTETCFNHVLRGHGIAPKLIGQETNFERFVDGNVDHCRSTGGAKLIGHEHYLTACEWLDRAIPEAWERAERWREEAFAVVTGDCEREIMAVQEQIAEQQARLVRLEQLHADLSPRGERRRRNRLPHNTTYGKYLGQGPQFEDAVDGSYYPIRTHAHKQRGGLVSRFFRDGTRDRPDDYED